MNRVRVGLVSEIFHRKDRGDVSRQSLEHMRTRSLGASLIVTNIFGPSGMGFSRTDSRLPHSFVPLPHWEQTSTADENTCDTTCASAGDRSRKPVCW